MKTLAELQAIRDKAREKMTVRDNNEEATRVVAKRHLNNVTVTQTGCIGMCQLEPIVEVFVPGKEKVTYAKVSPEKVARIVADHLVNGNVVAEYTVGSLMK